MMAKYEIADILIEFKPYYEDYLETFAPFRYDGERGAKYIIQTFVSDHLDAPTGEPSYTNQDRIVHTDFLGVTTYKKNENGEVMIKTYQSNDLQQSYLYLKKGDSASNAEREYIFTGMFFMKIALKEQRLGLHGSAIAKNGEAVIFSAPSRTGKSTHRHLWEKLFSIETINDDKPLLMLKDNQAWVCPSPWSGKSRLTGTSAYPLKTIVFLAQGKKNRIETLDTKKSLTHLMRNCYRPDEPVLWDPLFKILNHLTNHIPMYYYACTMKDKAALTLHSYLFGGHDEN